MTSKLRDPMETFQIEVTEENRGVFARIMREWQESMVGYVKSIASELDVSEPVALEIVYLRTRSRHTQLLEDRIIRAHHVTGHEHFRACAGEESEVLRQMGF